MKTTPNAQLLEWIRKLAVDLTPDGSITRLELYHAIEGNAGERLSTVEMADRDEEEDPDDLAQELWDEACQDASTQPQGTHQRYIVRAFRADSTEAEEQKAFTLTGKAVSALVGGSTEPPTARGELSMNMRHADNLHAMVIRMTEATAGTAVTQLQKEREENNRLRAASYEYAKLREEMLDRSQERDIRRQEFQTGQARTAQLLGVVTNMLPVLIAKFVTPPALATGTAQAASPLGVAPTDAMAAAAAPAAPAAAVARDAAVGQLLSTVTPEQMQVLIGTFDETQTLAFVELYGSHKQASEQAEQAAAQAAQAAQQAAPVPGGSAPQTPTKESDNAPTSN